MDATETNLQKLMRAKNLTTQSVAAVIGVTDTQALRKIKGEYPFKLHEAVAIYNNLFNEFAFMYVFAGYCDTDEPKYLS